MKKTLLTLAVLGLLTASMPTATAYQLYNPEPIGIVTPSFTLCPTYGGEAVEYCIRTGSNEQSQTVLVPDPQVVTFDFCPAAQVPCVPLVSVPPLLGTQEQIVTVGVPTVEEARVDVHEEVINDAVCQVLTGQPCPE